MDEGIEREALPLVEHVHVQAQHAYGDEHLCQCVCVCFACMCV